jgi:hypothetical protein
MKTARILSNGLAGAAAAITIRKTIKNKHVSVGDKNALVKQSFSKLINNFRGNVPLIGKSFSYTLSEDMLNLSFYYNLSRLRKHKHVFVKAAFAGLTAGVGVLLLPMILDYKHGFEKNSIKGKVIIMGLNVVGAMLAASLLHFVSTNNDCRSKNEIRSTYSASQVIGFDEE